MEGGRLVVAVDGPAGSGKSSVSREAALRLGMRYIDSGAIYRAITHYLLGRFGSLEKGKSYAEFLDGLKIDQRFEPDGSVRTSVNGLDVSRAIRDEAIARGIGAVSDDPGVRNFVNELLRSWSARESLIMDGRDIGTVVFPDATVKIYLDASVEVRSIRRVAEYREMGKTVDVNEIRNQIIRRDQEDTARPFGRLQKAEGSFYIDTSSMEKDEVIERMIGLIAKADGPRVRDGRPE